jgi:hypothetical protein
MDENQLIIQIDDKILQDLSIDEKTIIKNCEDFLGYKYHQGYDMWSRKVHHYFVVTGSNRLAACSMDYILYELNEQYSIVNYTDILKSEPKAPITSEVKSQINNTREFEEFSPEEV